jgi:hypothetical protein
VACNAWRLLLGIETYQPSGPIVGKIKPGENTKNYVFLHRNLRGVPGLVLSRPSMERWGLACVGKAKEFETMEIRILSL